MAQEPEVSAAASDEISDLGYEHAEPEIEVVRYWYLCSRCGPVLARLTFQLIALIGERPPELIHRYCGSKMRILTGRPVQNQEARMAEVLTEHHRRPGMSTADIAREIEQRIERLSTGQRLNLLAYLRGSIPTEVLADLEGGPTRYLAGRWQTIVGVEIHKVSEELENLEATGYRVTLCQEQTGSGRFILVGHREAKQL